MSVTVLGTLPLASFIGFKGIPFELQDTNTRAVPS
jgi:hypothetical protein